MNYFSLIKQAKVKINQAGLDPNVAPYLIQRRLHWDNTRLLMEYRSPVPQKMIHQYRSDLSRYLKGIPPQYVIGTAPFYGYDFKVNRNVLIPRPETEELVHWLLNDHPEQKLNVVDIGTGSGAIAITLKLRRPLWHVMATDVSSAALRVARINARLHHVKIDFKQCDLFHGLKTRSFDVIISNPPYVAESEVKFMDQDVLQYEPHLALFAKDNGMEMYERIARSFRDFLKPWGSLYLEFGFRQKQRIIRLFNSCVSRSGIRVTKDVAGHPRMVRVINYR